MSFLTEARKLVGLGYSPLPILPDGTKQPCPAHLPLIVDAKSGLSAPSWKPFQTRRATDDELVEMFSNGAMIGVVCGEASGNMEALDFDAPGYFERWRDSIDPELFAKLVIARTPSGCYHAWWRIPETPPGNHVVARDRDNKTAIETRGHGGYVVCAPSKGYKLVQGKYPSIPTITLDERHDLMDAAYALHDGAWQEHRYDKADPATKRPGDAYAAKTPWESILTADGWQFHSSRGENTYWTRPGKSNRQGKGASTNGELGFLYCFTSNAHPLQPGHAYRKFEYFAQTKHGGDFKAAAKSLRALGFGEFARKGFDSYETPYVTQRDVGTEYDFRGIDAGSVPCEPTEYYWRPYIPKGKGILLDGDSGTFKTSLILAVFAAFSNGVDVVSGQRIEPLKTLYFGKEDTPGELGTIYQAHGGKRGFCEIVPEVFSLTPKAIDAVAKMIRTSGAQVVVFDSYIYFLEGIVREINNSVQEIQAVTRAMLDVYQATGASGWHVRHTGKSVIGKSPAALGVGSYQFRASHRGQILVRRFPDLKRHKRHCYVTDEKGSILVEQGEPFAFERIGNELRFYTPDADPFEVDFSTVGRPDEQRQKCAQVIRANLVGGETKWASDLLAVAESLGLNVDTFRRAAKDIGVLIHRDGRRWTWTMPDPFDDKPPHWAGLD